MKEKLFYLLVPLLLNGCIGTYLSGETGYLCEDYPDIRSVPERIEANKSRGLHPCNEKAARKVDFINLEKDRVEIQERDKALRRE